MKPRTLLILTLLVAVLGAFIFFFEKDAPSTDERAEQAKKVLLLETDDVRAVKIAWSGEEVLLERQEPEKKDEEEEDGEEDEGDVFAPDPEWLVEPLAARADRGAVDGLLSTLAGLEKERTLEDADRSALGFDEPRGRVTLTTAEGETVLEIGAEVPVSSDMLVAVAGRDEVYQVAGSVWSDLTKKPGDWRAKDLFTATRADVDRLTLYSGGDRLTRPSGDDRLLLAQRGDDFWIESPLADLADESLVNGLMTEVTGLRAETFLDDPELADPEKLAELGLEPADKVLEVVLKGREEPFRLELGKVAAGGEDADASMPSGAPTVYARFGDQLVEVRTRLLDSFARPAPEWRSRDWTPLQVFRVETARLEDAAGTVEVVRDGSDWLRGDDRIAYSTASDVLYAIADARAEEVLSRDEVAARGHRLDEPALEVTLETEDSSQSLALYPPVEGFAAATREGRDAVLLLPSSAVDELTSKLAALREAEPLADEEEDDEGGDAEEPAGDS